MKMKKIWIMVLACIVMLTILLAFSLSKVVSTGNGEPDHTHVEAPEEKVKAAYLEVLKSEEPNDEYIQSMTIQDVHIEYYGNFGGKEFFMYKDIWGLDIEEDVELGGYTFNFSSSGYYPNYFLCLTEDGIFTVKDAYEEGIITQEDLHELAVARGDIVESAE